MTTVNGPDLDDYITEHWGEGQLEEEAAFVRSLLRKHAPTGVYGTPFPPSDYPVNEWLLGSDAPLPVQATTQTIAALADELGITASLNYWKEFRRAAVVVTMRAAQRGSATATVGDVARELAGVITSATGRPVRGSNDD